jgi:hypothetical protein
MPRASRIIGTLLLSLTSLASVAAPSVYPTGVTIYDPAQTWNGYTVLSLLGTQAVVVIDMNGTEVKRWNGFNNSAGGPAVVLPGGGVIAPVGARPPHQESLALVQRDFDGDRVSITTSRWKRATARNSGRRGSITIGSAPIFLPATFRPRRVRPGPERRPCF